MLPIYQPLSLAEAARPHSACHAIRAITILATGCRGAFACRAVYAVIRRAAEALERLMSPLSCR